MKYPAWAIVTWIAAVCPLGCGQTAGPQPAGGKLRVAVSVAPQAWLVEQIGGERVEVVTLIGPAQSPATYQPSDAQVSGLMRAAVYFRIGVPFENGPWFRGIEGSEKPVIVDLRQGIHLRDIGDHHHEHPREQHGKDPHVWLSPRNLTIMAATIAKTFTDIDAAHAQDYADSRAALELRLEQTDRAITAMTEPIRGKAFIVFHPGWGYFADEYGLQQIAIEIEGQQPADHELTGLQAEARRLGVKMIFVQPQFGGAAAHAVAAAIGARVETVDPLAHDVAANLVHVAEVLAGSYD